MYTQGIIGQFARIREASNLLIEKELKARCIEGIVPAHGPALVFLFKQNKPVPIKAVVDSIGRVKSTVTVMIKALDKHGYIKKSPCGIDNRVINIELTPKGRKVQKDFDEISNILIDKVYGGMKKKHQEELVKQLNQIEQNLCE